MNQREMEDQPVEEQGLVVRDSNEMLPAPVFNGAAMARAMREYKELQNALDSSMPTALIEIQGRQFRKKAYWRSVAMSFKLKVEFVSEHKEIAGKFDDDLDNFGYNVIYRATAPNGSFADGDGASYAIEKASKQDHKDGTAWQRRPFGASEHNVRSHAHTRAYNRAVSNLCGFGEVSYEEMPEGAEVIQAQPAQRQVVTAHIVEEMQSEFPEEGNQQRQHPTQRQAQQRPAQRQPAPGAQRRSGSNQAGGGGVISEGQAKRLYAIAQSNGWGKDYKPALKEVWGIEDDRQIPRGQYDEIVAWAENGPPQ